MTKKLLIFAATLAIVLIALGIYGYFVLRSVVSTAQVEANSLPAELAAARREGLPLEPSDLRPATPIPDDQNAANVYRAISPKISHLPSIPSDSIANVAIGDGTTKDIAKVQNYLTHHENQLSQIEGASYLPHCDFKPRWEEGMELLFPDFARLREVARLFAARAMLKSKSGDPIGALSDIATAGRIARHAGEVPTIIGSLVQIAIDAIADRAFLQVLHAHSTDSKVLQAAQSAAAAFDPSPDVAHTFGGEAVMLRMTIHKIRDSTEALDESVAHFVPIRLKNRRVWCDAWEARMIHYWRRVYAIFSRTKNDQLAQFQALEKEGARMDAQSKLPMHEVDGILTPMYGLVWLKATEANARGLLRSTMLLLFEYRIKHGHFPATLVDIHAPNDPFTGSSLHYRTTSKGLILYSVGANFKDDGGKTSYKNPPDIAVSYP